MIDGDTVELADGRTIRYIGVDTPETVAPGQPVGCFGPQASARNKALVEGKAVELEKDVSETDRFGRTLRYVYVDGQLVNELLVLEGFAQVSTFPPDVKYVDRFTAAQTTARNAGRGLWGGCAATATPAPPVVSASPVGQGCHPSYPTICLPVGQDVDCPQIPQYRNFTVLSPDPYRLDGSDNDGIGCEM